MGKHLESLPTISDTISTGFARSPQYWRDGLQSPMNLQVQCQHDIYSLFPTKFAITYGLSSSLINMWCLLKTPSESRNWDLRAAADLQANVPGGSTHSTILNDS